MKSLSHVARPAANDRFTVVLMLTLCANLLFVRAAKHTTLRGAKIGLLHEVHGNFPHCQSFFCALAAEAKLRPHTWQPNESGAGSPSRREGFEKADRVRLVDQSQFLLPVR
jgi:hypothetical protein